MDRIEVHTNFTNTRPAVHALTLDTLAREPAEGLRVLRAVMTDPESLRPARSPEEVTAEAAARFAENAAVLPQLADECPGSAHSFPCCTLAG